MYLPTRSPQLFLVCVLEGVSSAPIGSPPPRGAETTPLASGDDASDLLSLFAHDTSDRPPTPFPGNLSRLAANVSQEDARAMVNYLVRYIPYKMASHNGTERDEEMSLADALSTLETALERFNGSKFTLDDGRVVYRDSRRDPMAADLISPVPAGNTSPSPAGLYPEVAGEGERSVSHTVDVSESRMSLDSELPVGKGITQEIRATRNVAARNVNEDDDFGNGTTPSVNKDDLGNSTTPAAIYKDDDLGNGTTPSVNKDDDLGNGLTSAVNNDDSSLESVSTPGLIEDDTVLNASTTAANEDSLDNASTPGFNKDDSFNTVSTPCFNDDEVLDNTSTTAANEDDSLDNASTTALNEEDSSVNASTPALNEDDSLDNASTRPTALNEEDSLDNASTPALNKDDSLDNASTTALNKDDSLDSVSTPAFNENNSLVKTSTTAAANKDDSSDNSSTRAFNKDYSLDIVSTPALNEDDSLDNTSTTVFNKDVSFNNASTTAVIKDDSLDNVPTPAFGSTHTISKDDVGDASTPAVTKDDFDGSLTHAVNAGDDAESALISLQDIGVGITSETKRKGKVPVRRSLSTNVNNASSTLEGGSTSRLRETPLIAQRSSQTEHPKPKQSRQDDNETETENNTPVLSGNVTSHGSDTFDSRVSPIVWPMPAAKVNVETFVGNDVPTAKDAKAVAHEDAYEIENEVSFLVTGHRLQDRRGKESAIGGAEGKVGPGEGKRKHELERGNDITAGVSDAIVFLNDIMSKDDNETELWQIDELIKKMLSEVTLEGEGSETHAIAGDGGENIDVVIEAVRKGSESDPEEGTSVEIRGDSSSSSSPSITPVSDEARVSGSHSNIESPHREIESPDSDVRPARNSTQTHERAKRKRETDGNHADELPKVSTNNASSRNDSGDANATGGDMSASASNVVGETESARELHFEEKDGVLTMNETTANRTRASLANILNRARQLLTDIGLIKANNTISEAGIDDLVSSLTDSKRWSALDVDFRLSREAMDTVEKFRGDFESLLAIYDEGANASGDARARRASGLAEKVSELETRVTNKTLPRRGNVSTESGNETSVIGNATEGSVGKSDAIDRQPVESTETREETVAISSSSRDENQNKSVGREHGNYLGVETLPKTGVKSNESTLQEDWRKFSSQLLANQNNVDQQYLLYDLSLDELPLWFVAEDDGFQRTRPDGSPIAMQVREARGEGHRPLNVRDPVASTPPHPPEHRGKPSETPPEQKYSEGDGTGSDSNYLLTVTLPSFLGLLILVILCCICMRASSICCRIFEADVSHGGGTLIEDDAHMHSVAPSQYTARSGRSRRSMV